MQSLIVSFLFYYVSSAVLVQTCIRTKIDPPDIWRTSVEVVGMELIRLIEKITAGSTAASLLALD